MEKILTVVVPTYNMERYLDRCLSSLIVAPELMKLLEVIVVNDGSKDRSSEIAHGYADRYPDTFVVIDKENGNYGSCVNKGIELARGKYFRILDADDWYNTESFYCFCKILTKTETDLVYSKKRTHKEKSDVVSFITPCLLTGSAISLSEFDNCENKPYLFMHGLSYKTDILRRSGLTLHTGISYTDNEYCYYPLAFVNDILFTDLVVYEYDMNRPGQTMSPERLQKSIGDLFTVVYCMVKEHNQSQLNRDSAQYHIQEYFLVDAVKAFFRTVITMCRPTKKNKLLLEQMDVELKNNAQIYAGVGELKIRRIKYVRLWRKTGILYGGLPLGGYNFLYDLFKRIFAR